MQSKILMHFSLSGSLWSYINQLNFFHDFLFKNIKKILQIDLKLPKNSKEKEKIFGHRKNFKQIPQFFSKVSSNPLLKILMTNWSFDFMTLTQKEKNSIKNDLDIISICRAHILVKAKNLLLFFPLNYLGDLLIRFPL